VKFLHGAAAVNMESYQNATGYTGKADMVRICESEDLLIRLHSFLRNTDEDWRGELFKIDCGLVLQFFICSNLY
jgi:hypothetical protein